MRIYLDKGYVAQGKDEKYLLGIIRNQDPAKQTHGKPEYPKFLSFEDIEAINDAG